MQSGYGRYIASFLVPALISGFLVFYFPDDLEIIKNLFSGFQKVAFVTAAFAVTAYNLRTRVVDLVLKIEGNPSKVHEFGVIARACGIRLTNLVILFISASVYLSVITIIPESSDIAPYAAGMAFFLLFSSAVSFVYILFSFERLERFALDEAEKKAADAEAKRLFEKKQ